MACLISKCLFSSGELYETSHEGALLLDCPCVKLTW